MKILHISAAARESGAGNGALLTHRTLVEYGIDSKLLYLTGQYCPDQNILSYASNRRWNKIKRFGVTTLDTCPTWIYTHKKEQLFSTGFFGISLQYTEFVQWADILHIHWANHGFIDLKEISKWKKPVIWTMRDMWPFTGGCHHSSGCKMYLSLCGCCPVLGSKWENDLSSKAMRRKLRYLPVADIHWVAISNWLKSKASSSAILKNESIQLIFSGIDCTTFSMVDKGNARALLHLPFEAKIILIGAANIREEYKGYRYAINALNKISREYLIVTFGSGKINPDEVPQRILNLGYINAKNELAALYSAADLFLAPSVDEAFGKTFAEAQACGLPVVCFDETGPSDIIEHRQTGYLAKFKDEEDLTKGLLLCLKGEFDQDYISNRAKALFDIHKIGKQYIELYEKCLEHSQA